MRRPAEGRIGPEKRKPRRANVEALNNVVPFRLRKEDMPNNTAAARPLQAQEPFDRCVVQLRPNVDASLAAANASCLLRGLRGMAQGGVDGEGFDPDQCFLLRSSIDTVIALVDSLEASVGRAA